MLVSRQSEANPEKAAGAPGGDPKGGPRARTGRLMLETAIRLMQAGAIPSVSEVAEAAGVSRATAYRYFPSQAALVGAVVDQALGPILTWMPSSQDPARRVAELIGTGLPRIEAFEATFKAALKLSLEQWSRGRAGTLGEIGEFLALGVGRSDDVDALHVSSPRLTPHRGRRTAACGGPTPPLLRFCETSVSY